MNEPIPKPPLGEAPNLAESEEAKVLRFPGADVILSAFAFNSAMSRNEATLTHRTSGESVLLVITKKDEERLQRMGDNERHAYFQTKLDNAVTRLREKVDKPDKPLIEIAKR